MIASSPPLAAVPSCAHSFTIASSPRCSPSLLALPLMRRSSMGPLGGGARGAGGALNLLRRITQLICPPRQKPRQKLSAPRPHPCSAPSTAGVAPAHNSSRGCARTDYCAKYWRASRANKSRASSRSRPDSGWALLAARPNFARGRFSNGRPALRSQLSEALAERQRSRSAS